MRLAELDIDRQTIVGVGHNNPPSPIEDASAAMVDLSKFLSDTPVVQTIEQAKDGALYVERSRKTLQDLDDARKRETGPLNERVKAINETYRAVRDPMDKVLSELRRRMTDYTAREEARRIREAEDQRKAAELLEIEARLAEQHERDTKENATFGEVVDVAEAIVAADQAFTTFKKADRTAALAERDTHVRLPSQLGGKALSMRTKETLKLDDATAAIACMGLTEKLTDAILSAARDYRKQHDMLPPGVSSVLTREI